MFKVFSGREAGCSCDYLGTLARERFAFDSSTAHTFFENRFAFSKKSRYSSIELV
ncbi:MAG: hypothetical protein KOO69_06270 [Victivallales bacterium]|nr:hypothetical protein [Victivallales bacterium]